MGPVSCGDARTRVSDRRPRQSAKGDAEVSICTCGLVEAVGSYNYLYLCCDSLNDPLQWIMYFLASAQGTLERHIE